MLTHHSLDNNPTLQNDSKDIDLHNAARNCDVDQIKSLLKENVDVNSRNKKLATPLMLAIQCINRRKQQDRIEVIRLLLDAKADPNLADNEGNTALMEVALTEEFSMKPLEMLLSTPNIDVNAVNAPGECGDVGHATALHMAISREKPYSAQMIQLLLTAKNINLEIKDQEGITPLGIALQMGNEEACKLLMNAKADIEKTGMLPFELKFNSLYQLTKKAEINRKYHNLYPKITKIKNTLTLPFYENSADAVKVQQNECFKAWLTVGAGMKFAPYLEEMSKRLKDILVKHNALYQYQYALINDSLFPNENLYFFFEQFPQVFKFFTTELEKDNSILEQVHESFWKGLKLSDEDLAKKGNTYGIRPDFEKWKTAHLSYESKMSTQKITLRMREQPADISKSSEIKMLSDEVDVPASFSNFELTAEEYDFALTTLGMKESTQNPNPPPTDLKRIKDVVTLFRAGKLDDSYAIVLDATWRKYLDDIFKNKLFIDTAMSNNNSYTF